MLRSAAAFLVTIAFACAAFPQTAAPQLTPSATYAGGRLVMVWQEGGAIVASVGGARLVVGPANGEVQHDPDVAAAGNSILIAWRSDTSKHRRVLACDVRLDGTVLIAPTPFVVDDRATDFYPAHHDRVSIATNGREFLVAWTQLSVVLATRISMNGTILDAQPIQAAQFSALATVTAARAVWFDREYVVVFALDPPLEGPALETSSVSLYLARITEAGVAPDSERAVLLYRSDNASWFDLAAAAWGDRIFVTWIEQAGVHTPLVQFINATFSEATTGNAQAHTLETIDVLNGAYTISTLFSIGAASHAGEFAAIWTRGTGAADDTHAAIVGWAPFAMPVTNVVSVAAAGGPSGFTFVYSRKDEQAGMVERVSSRDVTAPVTRRRAAR